MSSNKLLEDVKKYFTIDEFRFSQEGIINAMLDGRDVMAVLPTGGGKSLCYQYAAMKLPGMAVVVSPLIALMHDQTAQLGMLNIPATTINKDIPAKEQGKIMEGLVKGQYKILYISPERLASPKFVRLAKKLNISLVVVDEAHCASMWGYDFRPEYLKIPRFFKMAGKRPAIAAFTATATEYVKNDIVKILHMKNPFISNDGYVRENLKLSVHHIKTQNGKYRGIYAFLNRHKDESGIIYCATVEHVKEVYQHLKINDYSVTYYHATLDEEEKKKNFQDFMNDEKRIMVATNAFGMGINKGNIRFVVHFDMTRDIESYYQEIGRAARDGGLGECVLFYMPKDENIFNGPNENPLIKKKVDGYLLKSINALDAKRLGAMKEYVDLGFKGKSPQLHKKIVEYFSDDNFESQLSKDVEKSKDRYIKGLLDVDVLYTNETKVSKAIRNGTYNCCEENIVNITTGKEKKYVKFFIDTKLSYFDMMVADAIYTLHVWGKDKIYLRNILELMAGDEDATMKPISKDKSGKQNAILESIHKMMDTQIKIIDSFNQVFTGEFLKLEKTGKSAYKVVETPILYRYAEASHGQFFTIDKKLLNVISKEKKMPNSIENLKLRHYIARRMLLSKPYRSKDSGKPASRRILFENQIASRVGMIDILDIDLGENIYLKKRKYATIVEKVCQILDYYILMDEIKSYNLIRGEDKSVIGVEIDYYK